YLRMAARGDVLNALQKVRRRANRQTSLDAVELHGVARNVTTEGTHDPADIVTRGSEAPPGLLAAADAAFSPRERAVVELMLDGERRTPVYARLLELEHLSIADQAREVKRVKDRLDKRLRRLAPRVPRDG